MNDRAITSAMIAAVMKTNQSYNGSGLAKMFGISAGTMRLLLDVTVATGAVECRITNGVRLYSLPVNGTPALSMKPLTISREMRAAQERCDELYVYPSKY